MSTATGIAIGTAIASSSNHSFDASQMTQGDAFLLLAIIVSSLAAGIIFGIRVRKNGADLVESSIFGLIAFGVAITVLFLALALIGLLCVALGIA